MIFNQPQYRFYKEYIILNYDIIPDYMCHFADRLIADRFISVKIVIFEYKNFSGGTCAKLNHLSLSDFNLEPQNILLIDI